MIKYSIVRGARFIQWLNEDSTYPALKSNITRAFPNTTRRQNVANQVKVKKLEYIPLVANGALQVDADVHSSTTVYQVSVIFPKVVFHQQDSQSNVTVTTGSGAQQSFDPIPLANTNLKVRCTCMDFRFRFALWNFNDNSLVGNKPPLYVRKTTTRPPANPSATPGVCKHIIKVVDTLRSQKVVK